MTMARAPLDANPTSVTVAARQVLLDALEALHAHHRALIVVGAQAVYLRSRDADFTVAAFTTDGDITLDPAHLGPDPRLDAAMEAGGFMLAHGPGGDAQPGKWLRTVEIGGVPYAIPVDLIVPAGLNGTSRTTRGARIPPHSKTSAMRTPGLEAVVADHGSMLITSLSDREDRREITANVAGVVALLIAKAHKINDPLRDASRGRVSRLVDKDAGDVVRLMGSSTAVGSRATLIRLLGDEAVGPTARVGTELLHTQFGTRSAPGVEMAVRALVGGSSNEAEVRNLCVAYTRVLVAGLDS
jgi:hypothetical protein